MGSIPSLNSAFLVRCGDPVRGQETAPQGSLAGPTINSNWRIRGKQQLRHKWDTAARMARDPNADFRTSKAEMTMCCLGFMF